jgi:hypothetical protein
MFTVRTALTGLTISVAASLLGGCVTHTFAPGPGMSALDFEPDSAQCRLFARGSRSGFAFGAAGSPKFVGATMGGAALGYAIGSAVEANQNFNDCMQARGWRIADGQATSDPSMAGKLASTEQPPALPTIQPALATTTGKPPIVLASTSVPATRNSFLVRAAVVTPAMANAVHLDPVHGVMILSVGIGGAAMEAGLLERDVILDFNGSTVNNESDMQRTLAAIAPNSTVIATVWRDSTERSVMVRF